MDKDLWTQAVEARQNAYAPYSGFAVGAAVKTAGGNIYRGCNVENASYGLSCCAERCVVFQAVAAGEKDLEEICIVADTPEPVSPCGACRQVLAEFKIKKIVLANIRGNHREYTLEELLPYGFTL